MTRSELVAALAQRFPQLTLQDADSAVKEILAALASTLTHGDRVDIHV